MKFNKYIKIIIIIILIIFFLFIRFINLDADRLLPVFAKVNDEFYKSSAAIYKVNFGTWLNDNGNSGLMHAPLYSTMILYPIYKFLGVSLITTRLLSVLAGILSVFLLYLILRKENKKVALFAALLLSINTIFFTLNRVGLPESLVIACMLFGFYVISFNEKRTANYLLAGLIMGLAFLLKVSQLYIMPALVLFLIMQKINKKISIKHIIYFATSYGLVLLGYFIYIKLNYPIFEPMIEFTRLINFTPLFIARPLLLLVNRFLSFPSIFFLILLTIIFFRVFGFPSFSLRGFIHYSKSISFVERVSFSWLFGIFFGVIFTSLVDRRFSSIVIPLVIYSSLLLYKKKSSNKMINVQEKNASLFETGAVFILFLSVLFNYLIVINENFFQSLSKIFLFDVFPGYYNLILNLIKNPCFIFTTLLLLGGTSLFIISYFKLRKHVGFRIKLIKLGFFLLLSLLVLGFIKFNYLLFLDNLFKIPIWIIGTLSFVSSCWLYLKITKTPSSTSKKIFKTYFIYCITLILLFSLLFPSFSIKEASQKIDELTNEGDFIIGYYSPGLSIESHTKPLLNIFRPPFQDLINYSVYDRYKPVLYLTDPKETYPPKKEEIPYPLEYITTFELNPLFGFGKPQKVIELYRIDYNTNYTQNDDLCFFTDCHNILISQNWGTSQN